MTEDVRLVLVNFLTKNYANLKRRVTRVLGNGDLADDALQDTWLRVNSTEDDGQIRSPASYLVRMAINIAVDIQRRQGKSLPFDEVNALMELSDPTPGPEQVAEGRSDLKFMLKLVERMPKRRREIMLLVHMEDMEQKDVAKRLGISVRTVGYELQHAHDFLNARMNDDKK